MPPAPDEIGTIKWPAKEVDYESNDDYEKNFNGDIVNADSIEKFKKGQYVCAMQGSDERAYASFLIKDEHSPVTALLRANNKMGYLKHYPQGMYNLVEFVDILPGVCFCVTSVVELTHPCVGQKPYVEFWPDEHFSLLGRDTIVASR